MLGDIRKIGQLNKSQKQHKNCASSRCVPGSVNGIIRMNAPVDTVKSVLCHKVT